MQSSPRHHGLTSVLSGVSDELLCRSYRSTWMSRCQCNCLFCLFAVHAGWLIPSFDSASRLMRSTVLPFSSCGWALFAPFLLLLACHSLANYSLPQLKHTLLWFFAYLSIITFANLSSFFFWCFQKTGRLRSFVCWEWFFVFFFFIVNTCIFFATTFICECHVICFDFLLIVCCTTCSKNTWPWISVQIHPTVSLPSLPPLHMVFVSLQGIYLAYPGRWLP